MISFIHTLAFCLCANTFVLAQPTYKSDSDIRDQVKTYFPLVRKANDCVNGNTPPDEKSTPDMHSGLNGDEPKENKSSNSLINSIKNDEVKNDNQIQNNVVDKPTEVPSRETPFTNNDNGSGVTQSDKITAPGAETTSENISKGTKDNPNEISNDINSKEGSQMNREQKKNNVRNFLSTLKSISSEGDDEGYKRYFEDNIGKLDLSHEERAQLKYSEEKTYYKNRAMRYRPPGFVEK